MSNIIEIKGISKRFFRGQRPKNTFKEHFVNPFFRPKQEKFFAVKDLSFDVRKGEFFGIIGRNGSGKSTLLKLMAGIMDPTSGSIEVRGSMVPFLELGVGFNPELTARENIYLNGTILGMTKKEINKKFNDIIEFAEVGEFIDTQVKNFSSGMYVRLAFAIAIQTDADIYLIDEILAVGDYAFQNKCFNLFKKFKNSGKTFIFVSHDLGVVREFCNRVMYIKGGELINIGTTEDIIEDYIVNDRKAERDTFDGGDLNIELLGEDQKRVESTVVGNDLYIVVDYNLKEEVLKEDLSLGISIHDDNDLHFFGTNTQKEGVKMDFQKKGKVIFQIKNMPLMRGQYSVSAAISNADGKNFVWKNEGAHFSVINTQVRDGLINLDLKISVE